MNETASYNAVFQLMEWKRFKEALAEAQKLLQENPEDSYTIALIANIYYLQEDYKKALHWANEALARNPEETLAWYVRVKVFYDTDDEKAFSEAVEEALRIEPDEEQYYFLKANRLVKKGKFKEAKEQLGLALELDPDNPVFLAHLSYLEALLKNDAESRQLDSQAIQKDPENPFVLLYLAWAAGQRGEYELQETYMKNAIRLFPDDKQFQEEYLEALQQNHKLFRIFLRPIRFLRRMKPWQILLVWFAAWFLFKPLVILFIVLYVLVHWVTKAIVHVRVFGWRGRGA